MFHECERMILSARQIPDPQFMTEGTLHFSIKNELSELAVAAERVEEFLSCRGVSMKTLHQVNLALDEIITNIISYAYPQPSSQSIDITMELKGNLLNIEVQDHGIEFNPLEKDDPDTTRPLEEREIGGLGIFFAKKSMDHMSYERVDDRNILRMQKRG